MRGFCVLMLALILSACGASDDAMNADVSNARAVSEGDQRFVLTLYSTPTMTFSTAKSCYGLVKLGEAEMKKTPGIVGKVFGEHTKTYWRFLVDIGSESDASKKDLLVNGRFVSSDVEPSFTLTGGMTERSEQCGFVTGQAFIMSGFLNIGDMIGADDVNDGVTFESDEQLGMYLLGQAADDVYSSKRSMIADCAATMITALPQGDDPDASSVVWISALSDLVSEGDVKVASLSETSAALKSLINGKGDLAMPLEKIDKELQSSCTEIANSAVLAAQAGIE